MTGKRSIPSSFGGASRSSENVEKRCEMAELSFGDALNQAIKKEEMRRDPNVFVMGESIRGGVYGVTGGLSQEFGDERVLDTPLSENGFMGAAVGAAAGGMRPIVGSLASFMWGLWTS